MITGRSAKISCLVPGIGQPESGAERNCGKNTRLKIFTREVHHATIELCKDLALYAVRTSGCGDAFPDPSKSGIEDKLYRQKMIASGEQVGKVLDPVWHRDFCDLCRDGLTKAV